MVRQRITVQHILSSGRQHEVFHFPAPERNSQPLTGGREDTKMPLARMCKGNQTRKYREAYPYRTPTHHDGVQGLWNVLCSPGFAPEAHEKLVRGFQKERYNVTNGGPCS